MDLFGLDILDVLFFFFLIDKERYLRCSFIIQELKHKSFEVKHQLKGHVEVLVVAGCFVGTLCYVF